MTKRTLPSSYTARRIWKCKACGHQFSVTSGTIFASRKLPIRDYLAAIAIFVNAAKGISALQLGRDLNVQYQTAFVLAHKLREAISAEQIKGNLSGVVEVDGAYFGGHTRKENEAKDRKDRRKAENQTGKRQSVVVARERDGRTFPFVVAKESDAIPVIRANVAPDTVVHADEAGGWDLLHAFYDVKRITHTVAFSLDGACTNQAESYFSRLRRAELGQHHRIIASTASISPPTPSRWRGARTHAGGATARSTARQRARRLGIRCRGSGPAIGSADGSLPRVWPFRLRGRARR